MKYDIMARYYKKSHRGLAPVIAQILLIAIAVVGGTITVVSAQGHINSSQISGYPKIEYVKLSGYDSSDAYLLRAHDGNLMSDGASGSFSDDGVKGIEERIAVYIQNNSAEKIIIKELRFGGSVFGYDGNGDTEVIFGSFSILKDTPESILSSPSPEIQAGEDATILIGLDSHIKMGRNVQLKLTTNNNFVMLGDVVIGSYKI